MIGWALVIFFSPASMPSEVGAVETQRHIDHRLDRFDHPGEDFFPVFFARPQVEIKRLRPGFDLLDGQFLEELGIFRGCSASLTFSEMM